MSRNYVHPHNNKTWAMKRNRMADTEYYGVGDYVSVLVNFQDGRTLPFGLIDRNFQLAYYHEKHQKFSKLINDEVIKEPNGFHYEPVLCRIKWILADKKGKNYPILIPICPATLYNLALNAGPDLIMHRVEMFIKMKRITINIGDFEWENTPANKSQKKTIECLQVLENGGLSYYQLWEAIGRPRPYPDEDAEVIYPDQSQSYQIGLPATITVRYKESCEIEHIDLAKLRRLDETNRLSNATVIITGGLLHLRVVL